MTYDRLNPSIETYAIGGTGGMAYKYGRVVSVSTQVETSQVTAVGYMTLGTLPASWRPSKDIATACARGDGSGATGIFQVRASDGAVRLYAPVAAKQYVCALTYVV